MEDTTEEWDKEAACAARLTRREIEVLELLVAGKTNKEIARAMCVSFETAKAHVSRVLRKTGTQTRTEAAIYWERRRGRG